MKAIAKHDCQVTLTTSLDSISLNRMDVKKGQAIELPAYKDETFPDGKISEVLGKRSVVFKIASCSSLPTQKTSITQSKKNKNIN